METTICGRWNRIERRYESYEREIGKYYTSEELREYKNQIEEMSKDSIYFFKNGNVVDLNNEIIFRPKYEGVFPAMLSKEFLIFREPIHQYEIDEVDFPLTFLERDYLILR